MESTSGSAVVGQLGARGLAAGRCRDTISRDAFDSTMASKKQQQVRDSSLVYAQMPSIF